MSTNYCIIKQEGQPPQNGDLTPVCLMVSWPKVYDELSWPRDPHTGQPYRFEQVVADTSLPLPQSNVARLIQQWRDHTANSSLPAEQRSPAEVRQQEAAQADEVYYLTSPLSAHVVRVSGSCGPLEYVAHIIYPQDQTAPGSNEPQLPSIQVSEGQNLGLVDLLLGAKAVIEDRAAEAKQPGERLAPLGVVWAESL